MKILLLTITFTLLNLTLGFCEDIPNWEDCSEQGLRQGGINAVSPHCWQHVKNTTDLNLSIKIEDGNKKYHIIGKDNILFNQIELFDDDNKLISSQVKIISGANTLISHINSIAYSKKRDEIYLLNSTDKGENSILIFKANRSGDIYPRPITDQSLMAAKSLALSQDEANILVNTSLGIIEFNAKSNSLSQHENRKPASVVLSSEKSNGANDGITSSKDSIFTLDKEANILNIINKESGEIVQKINLQDHKINSPQSIRYESDKRELLILEENGTLTSFTLD